MDDVDDDDAVDDHHDDDGFGFCFGIVCVWSQVIEPLLKTQNSYGVVCRHGWQAGCVCVCV